jgi:hypothetical protein
MIFFRFLISQVCRSWNNTVEENHINFNATQYDDTYSVCSKILCTPLVVKGQLTSNLQPMWFLASLSIMRQQSLGNLGRLCLNENYVLTSVDTTTWKEARTNITIFTSIKIKTVSCGIDYIPHNIPKYSHTQSEQRIRIMSWKEAPPTRGGCRRSSLRLDSQCTWIQCRGEILGILGRSVGRLKSSRVFRRPACYMLVILISLSFRGFPIDAWAVKWWVIPVMVLNELQPLPLLHSPTDSCEN